MTLGWIFLNINVKNGAEAARLGGDDLTIEAITAKVEELIAWAIEL